MVEAVIIEATHLVTNPAGNRPQDPSRLIGFAIHHSVGNNAVQSEADEMATIRAIDRQHVNQSFGGFGYHYIIFPSGRAYHCGEGQRAHVASRNHELRGIVMSGTFTDVQPTEAALQTLRGVLLHERARFGQLPVKGHREWALPGEGTACPGVIVPRDWEAFLQPTPARRFIAGDESCGIEKRGNQMFFWVNGVAGNAIGNFDGTLPGALYHLAGTEWEEIRK